MFGWLRVKKLKPTAAVATASRGVEVGRTPQSSTAAGTEELVPGIGGLETHPLLSLLPAGTLQRLLGDGALSEYAKGTTVFHAGQPCEAIYLVVSGRCEARRPGPEHLGQVEDVFGPGDLLGARALLNREDYSCTVVVVTRAILLRLPAADLVNLFTGDPSLAGRFSHTVTARPSVLRPRGSHVRRVVAWLSLSTRVDAPAMIRQLADSLHLITGQRVLVLDLGPERAGDSGATPLSKVTFGAEFGFALKVTSAGSFDEVRVTVPPETMDATGIAPLLSHCGWHYEFVLLLLRPETPAPVVLDGLIQSDLGFVLIEPSVQELYDFQLLAAELEQRNRDALASIRPILFAGATHAVDEVHATLRTLGHPVHSVIRGFPSLGEPAVPDRRFDLAVRRLAREIGRCRLGLALSSGGAKGLAHVGVIQVLEEHGIEVDCIAGASMGAYVGALWAYGFDGAKLEKLAREHEGRWGLLPLIDPVIPPRRGFLSTGRTVRRLRKSLGDTRFSELLRPLRVLATHLETLERVVFSSGDVVAAIEASIAIPGVCVPVTLDGETYIDGGIADPLPVDVLTELGIERIIAVNVIPTPEQMRYWLDAAHEPNGREIPRTRFGLFLSRHLNYGAGGNILDTMMRAINGAQTRVAESSAREADIVLRPLSGGSKWHDFTQPAKYIALGRSVAEARLSDIQALAGGTTHEPQPPLAIEFHVAA